MTAIQVSDISHPSGIFMKIRSSVKWGLFAASILVFVVVVRVWPHAENWMAVDTCLDAGGRWDHQLHHCQLDDVMDGSGSDRDAQRS